MKSAAIAMSSMGCLIAAAGCAGGTGSSSNDSILPGKDHGPVDATLITDKNQEQLDGYTLQEYINPGFHSVDCPKGHNEVAIDDFPGVERSVNGQSMTMFVTFAGEVPRAILITPEYQTIVYRLPDGASEFTLNLGYAGARDDDVDGSMDDDYEQKYGTDHALNYYDRPLIKVCD